MQTLNDEGKLADNLWYCGTVEAVYTSGAAKVVFDDGDKYTWPGSYAAQLIHVLPQGHPAFEEKMRAGAPTQEGLQRVDEVPGANGVLRQGTRVQTLFNEGKWADNKWYCGTVEAMYTSGSAVVVYDYEGETYAWPAEKAARAIFLLPPEHPAYGRKVSKGAPTQFGLPEDTAPLRG